ncbi:uncharacterized protein LOC121382382 [Gigantopelta aegis]|uniref:uncharacterized protein LOC121382382 n=1 Tax=Gigantopelta aegis TaxID=1735272 RepID=UPI001B889B55|nr:uncharacterized protein LOC121382382 [Gigantopelta aegis]
MKETYIICCGILSIAMTVAVAKLADNEVYLNLPVKNRCSKDKIHRMDVASRFLVCGICAKGNERHIDKHTKRIICRPCHRGYYNNGTMDICKKCKRCRGATKIKCTHKDDTVCQSDIRKLRKQKGKMLKQQGLVPAKKKPIRQHRNLKTGTICETSLYGKMCHYVVPETTSSSTFRPVTADPGDEESIDLEEDEPPTKQTHNTFVIVVIVATCFVIAISVAGLIHWYVKKRKLKTKNLKDNLLSSSRSTKLSSVTELRLHGCSYHESNTGSEIEMASSVHTALTPVACSSMNAFELKSYGSRFSKCMHMIDEDRYVRFPRCCSVDLHTSRRLQRHSTSSLTSFRAVISLQLANPSPSVSSSDSCVNLFNSRDMSLYDLEYDETVQKRSDIPIIINTLAMPKIINGEIGSECFQKSTDPDSQNIFSNYYKDKMTQTRVLLTPKNIFNGQWDMYGTFSEDGGRLMKDNSSAELILPRGAVAKGDSVEIHGSVFTDLEQMKEAFQLKQDEWMTSVAVEYYKQDGSRPFEKDVVVRLQHCLSSGFNPSFFNVSWFKKDDDGRIVKEKVPLKDGRDDDLEQATPWFEFGPGSTVVIHTRHFSGFCCSYCGHEGIPVSLTAMVFGSFEAARHEVRVLLYLWDTKCFIKDFNDYMMNDVCQGMTRFSKQEVQLLDDTPGQSLLICSLQPCGDGASRWQHILRPDGEKLVFKKKQIRKLNKIVKCCRESGPQLIQWALRGEDTADDVFQCIVDIHHVIDEDSHASDNEDGQTTVYISDLISPSSSRMSLQEVSDDLRETVKLLADKLTVYQTEELGRQFGIEHVSINRPIGHNPDSLSTKISILNKCITKNPRDFEKNNLQRVLGEIGVHGILDDPGYAFPELPVKSYQTDSYKKPIQVAEDSQNTTPKERINGDHVCCESPEEDSDAI